MSSSRRLGRNEPCWCGSGNKFKHCHKNRADEKPDNPFNAFRTFENHNKKRICLHPKRGSACSNQIVHAHTIQRANSLTRIAVDGHVLGFARDVTSLNRTGGCFELKRIGINKASTFNGFCASHDKTTFAPLEDWPFKATNEQCFLLGYRALCREFYQKETVLEAMPFLRGQDKGRSIVHQAYWQSKLSQMTRGYDAGYDDLKRMKARYDAVLLSEKFSEANSYTIELSVVPDVMASFGITVQYDFAGNRLQDLSDLDAEMDSIYVSIIGAEKGGFVVLSWLPSANGAADAFVSSLAAIDDHDLGDALVRLVFEQSENTYVHPSWWNGLSSECRDALINRATLAADLTAERKPDCLRPDGHSYVKWPISSRQHFSSRGE